MAKAGGMKEAGNVLGMHVWGRRLTSLSVSVLIREMRVLVLAPE